jgi:hypothetical protein
MKFGNIDINHELDWPKWNWKDFISFFETSLKGKIAETPEEVASSLGVKTPKKKS